MYSERKRFIPRARIPQYKIGGRFPYKSLELCEEWNSIDYYKGVLCFFFVLLTVHDIGTCNCKQFTYFTCFVASFKLSFVQLFFVDRVFCCGCLVCVCCYLMCICRTVWALIFFTLDAGLLARSQYPEGPATGHLDTGFSWFPCV